ncbi:MAG: ComEA family DNA-binding protein, partial [Bacilli bacterium]|nr:ComEA family DNA-binding protein [Bacilli bacterium]
KKIKIDIKGEINTPGVYELTEENNVMDAINLAGGLTNKSDTSNINLSKKLTDEMVIIVYSKQDIINMKEKEKITCPPCNNACIEEKDETSKINITEKQENKEVDGRININTANIEELQKLNGIGETKAKSIIDYRNKNGGFKDIEEIKNVQGIGEAAYEKIKNNITI